MAFHIESVARMTEKDLHDALDEYQALALTLWAEARGEPIDGIVGCGWVIKHRLARFGRYRAAVKTYKGVVLAPMQFSCWNMDRSPNHTRLLALAARVVNGDDIADDGLLECAWVAMGIIDGRLRDNVRGATHYLTTDLYRSSAAPRWAGRLRFVAERGAHSFLIEPAEPSLTQIA